MEHGLNGFARICTDKADDKKIRVHLRKSAKSVCVSGVVMSSFETKALLLAVLRYLQATSDVQQTEKFIEDLLMADSYVPEARKKGETKKRLQPSRKAGPDRGA